MQNPFNNASVTIDTCAAANGATLETGIVIVEQFHPFTDKLCATNTATCNVSPLLTIDQRPTVSGKKYKATVVYKSGTATGLNNITINWNYP